MRKSQISSMPNSNLTCSASELQDLPSLQVSGVTEEKNLNHSEIMMRISRELMEVMETTYENEERNKLLQDLEKIKKQYETELHSLRLKQHLQESTYNFNLQQQKNKYDELLHERDCLYFQNQKLKQEISKNRKQIEKLQAINTKYQLKVKNQQSLIDEYKKSIEQQINLQKQVIKAGYMERELTTKLQFQKALKSMEENYRRKISEIKYEVACKDFKNDVKSVKQFCNTLVKKRNKQSLMDVFNTENNQNLPIDQTNFKKMIGSSSYSTLAK